jgi:hypothetical protein
MSRKFSKELGRSLVVETSQTGAIAVGGEGVEAGIAFGMTEKAGGGGRARFCGIRARCSPRRRLKRSTMPLVCGRKGWVSRWAMASAAQTRSKAWSGRPVGDIEAGFSSAPRCADGCRARAPARHGRRCSAGYRRGSAGWWWHWRAAEVASAGASPRSSQGQALGRRAQRRDGVTRRLAPMGFQGMRKSTMMPNAQPRPRTATLASIARRRRPHHRESPTGYSLAGCSPAEPASASPAAPVYVHPPLRRHQHRCPHFVSPMVVHQPLAQPAHSSPQPLPFAPIF